MADVGRLAVKLVADTSGLSMGLDSAKTRVKDFEARTKSLQGSMSSLGEVSHQLKSKIGALAGAFSTAAFVGKLVETQRQFDVLNASMITMTGSSAAAEREFRWLKEFAATTPFALNEVVGAFVRMSSLGLDPSREALESYGNTASAMGKSLNQMIEAVADAATGEFERLKEFGIKASKEGDNVSLTFQGITTTIRNSAEEITGYLDKIGRNQFAGAMAERAKTLDGAISNLGDTWDELFRTINNANAGGLIYDSVKLATGAIEQATKIIDAMSSAANNNSTQTGAMAATLNGITTVFETVAVVGANVAFVLKSTGRELGGLAAQAAAVARLDFSGAKTIGQLMRADAIEARAEVDRLTAAILNARNASAAPADGGGRPSMPRRVASRDASAGSGGKGKDKGSIFDEGDPVANEIARRADAWREAEAKAADAQEEAQREAFAKRIESLKEYTKTEEQIAQERQAKQLEDLKLGREAGLLTEQEYMLMEQDMQMKHMDEMARIRGEGMKRMEDITLQSWDAQAQAVITKMGEMTAAASSGSKAMFSINKAAAIANALLKAKESVTSAYAFGSKIGGPPLGAAMAGVAAAATAAQISAIKSQSFSGSGGVSSNGGSVAPTQSAAAGGAGMAQTITIQGVNNGDLFSGDAVRTLIDKLIDAQRNGARIVLA